MAADKQSDYIDSVEFVNSIPQELEIYCSVCLDVLKDPQLTQCCGHHFCLGCYEALKKKHKPCPLCKDPHLKAVLNKGLKRIINGLKIYCTHKSQGCEWVGEFKDLPEHQKPDEREGDCLYTTVLCINDCGERIQRCLLKSHENETCTKRPYMDTLEMTRRLQSLTTDNKTLTDTVNLLKKTNMKNEQVVDSLKQQVKMCQADINLLKQQLALVIENSPLFLRTQIQNFPDDNMGGAEGGATALPDNVVPYEFTFDNFSRRCDNPELWFCRPFYTHTNGYKMCIRVAPQGLGNGEGTHVSVHSYLMKGEYDDMLVWPFRAIITLQLLNQIGNDCHHEQSSDFNDRTPEQYCRRVTQVERAGQGWGKSLFIARSELHYDPIRQVQYLKDDCLKFRVVSVVLHD